SALRCWQRRSQPGSAYRRAGAVAAPVCSSRNLPGGAFLGILDHDTHRRQLLSNTIGFLEVLARARGGPIRDQRIDSVLVHRDGLGLTFEVFTLRLAQQSEQNR